MTSELPFKNLYRHGFARMAVCVPDLRVADPAFNAARTIELAIQAAERGAVVALFPELGLTGYTCDDLFHQQALLEAGDTALKAVVEATKDLDMVAIVGLPVIVDGLLFNCAAILHHGRVQGLVPKSYLPNHREFYELRQFQPGHRSRSSVVELAGQGGVPFGTDLLFETPRIPGLTLFVEICEDLWVPVPPSCRASLAGATVLANLSASNATIGKEAYRRALVANQSARCMAAYLYTAAGPGESTNDLAWDGQGMIAENGQILAETERFFDGSTMAVTEIDLDRLTQERIRLSSFAQSVDREGPFDYRRIALDLLPPSSEELALERIFERFPYVPASTVERDARCRDAYSIQVQGLTQRLRATGIEHPVIGVSGGLDSTQALIVTARAMDRLGLDRKNILAYTMPGFATSERTLDQARRLMQAVGVTAHEIDIRPSCRQMLEDLGHPFARGEEVFDVTFENVQAGERTSHLFRLANQHRGLVVGTGDLSELALGWATYGVGDQMAHYNVNSSVPKTLIRYLIHWVAESDEASASDRKILHEVLGTEISPELVPGAEASGPSQRTEDTIGPYELQDFHLYYTLRFGYRPTKVAFMAWSAWRDASHGPWPDLVDGPLRTYDLAQVRRWLGVFLERFFGRSQFKRTCMPNGPKVGSGGSLSPRGDWRAPSDSSAVVWLENWGTIPEK